MYLHPGKEAEYQKRHNEIWPALKDELHRAGVSDYSIYWDPKTNILFAFQRVADDAAHDELAGKAIVKKWWHMMSDLMETNPDASPVCDALVEMFHLD
jgi:L-rhamnose mutarotase